MTFTAANPKLGPVRSGRGAFGIVIALVLLVVFVVVITAAATEDPETMFNFAVAFATISILTVMFAAYLRTKDTFNPITLVMAMYLLEFPLHAVIARDAPGTLSRLGYDRFESLAWALVVAGVGSFALYAGFRSKMAQRLQRRLPEFRLPIDDKDRAYLVKLAIVLVLAWGARFVLARAGKSFHFTTGTADAGGLTSFVYIFVTLETLSRLVMLLLLGSGLKLKNRLRVSAGLALLLAELAWGFATGSRLLMVLPLAAAAIMVGRVYWRVKLWHLLAAVLFFVAVIFPLLTAFRNVYSSNSAQYERGGFSESMIINAFEGAIDGDGDAAAGPSSLEVIAERMHGASSLALIIRYTPERHPFLYGEPYALLPLALGIPRAIWPDKPVMAAWAGDFRTKYWGLDRNSDTAIAVTQIGDLWVNLHLFGVILGSLIMGIGYRYLHGYLRMGSGAGSVYPVAVYATIIIPTIHQMATTFDMLIAGTLKLLLVYLAVAWFLAPRKKNSHSEPSPSVEYPHGR